MNLRGAQLKTKDLKPPDLEANWTPKCRPVRCGLLMRRAGPRCAPVPNGRFHRFLFKVGCLMSSINVVHSGRTPGIAQAGSGRMFVCELLSQPL